MVDLVAPETVGMSHERLQRIYNWMQGHVEHERLAGISVLVHRHGQNAFFGSAGGLATEGDTSIGMDSIFRIYSMTKPIVSVAAMSLYEEGRFQLDDPVARFLPEFEDMQVLVGGDADNPRLEPARSLITLRHLFTHTSGLTYDFMRSSPVDELYHRNGITFAAGDTSLAEVVTRLARQPLLCHPGTEWNYGVSTDVLGRVLEVMAGQPLDELLEERIFKPLRMVDTAFSVSPDKLGRFATMYTTASDAPPAPPLGEEITHVLPEPAGGLKLADPAAGGRFAGSVKVLSGGGGLTSTTADYLRFCRMLSNKGELDGRQVLGRKTVEFMTCNHLPGTMADMGQARFNNGHMGAGLGFGLGFAVVLDPALAQTQGSAGEYFWTGMANTQFWIDPEEDMIVIQMAQLMPSSLLPLRRDLRSLVYQALVE
ncbi:serine hydrolase domain-containing protein [Halomonas shantousis]